MQNLNFPPKDYEQIWQESNIFSFFSKDISHVTVATTRPETLLADVAVAVNPNDERYSALIGCHLRLPLVERRIPIVADQSVSREFGTGAVKACHCRVR